MPNSPCAREEELKAFAIGDLPSGEVARLAAHLETCQDCQRRLEAAERQDDPLLIALRAGDTVAPMVGISQRVPLRSALSLNPRLSGATSRLRDEVRELLHRRLRALAWIGAVTWIWFLLMQARGLNDSVTAQTQAIGARIMIAAAATHAACWVVLWRRRDLGVPALRAIELLLISLTIAYNGYYRYAALTGIPPSAGDPEYLRLRVEHATLLSNLYALLSIIFYGVFIPNTWRRCVVVVLAMSAVPVAVALYAGAQNPTIRPQLPTIIAVTVIGLFLADAIAVFGSFRISTLQRQAVEARQLGQYRLTRQIGAGGMGEVYRTRPLLRRPEL